MTKKEKTMEEMLAKVNMENIKSRASANQVTKIEALFDLLRKGAKWDTSEELRQLFGVLPDSLPMCIPYTSNSILVAIGKAYPIKVVQRPGIKDSRLKWVPIEESEKYNIPSQVPIVGYRIICGECHKNFVGKEAWHQNLCSLCSGRKPTKQKDETTPDRKPKPKKDKLPPTDSTPPTEKPKRRGRPPKSKTEKPSTTEEKPKAKRGRPPKKKTSSKSKRASSRPTKTKGGTRKKK